MSETKVLTTLDLTGLRVVNMDGTPIQPPPQMVVRKRSAIEARLAAQGVGLVPCPGCDPKQNVRLKVPAVAEAVVAASLAKAQEASRTPGQDHLRSLAQAVPSLPVDKTWACGMTTVPERRANGLLLRTLASLRTAGFGNPRLFVDGARDLGPGDGSGYEGDVTLRWPKVGTVGNWILSTWELLIRNPDAARFAIFQDDFVACQGLRAYLDAAPWPDKSYLNLFTFRENDAVVRGQAPGWHRGCNLNNESYPAHWQKGLGAVALCFTREGLVTLLNSKHLTDKATDTADENGRVRGRIRIDGAVVTAMNLAGWSEVVHQPSLVQHVGLESSMGSGPQAQALTFKGEEWDATSLLK